MLRRRFLITTCLLITTFLPVCAVELPPALRAELLAGYKGEELERAKAYDWKFLAVDLNGDGVAEYIVESGPEGCGSGGCSIMIFRKSGKGYHDIYEGGQVLTSASQFSRSVLATSSHGYRDLLFKNQKGRDVYFHVVYFDGRHYVDYSDCN